MLPDKAGLRWRTRSVQQKASKTIICPNKKELATKNSDTAMKSIRRYLSLAMLILMLQACGQLMFDQDSTNEITIAKQALTAIKIGTEDSIRAYFSTELNDRLSSIDINKLVRQTQVAMIDGLPADSLIQVSSNLSFKNGGRSKVTMLSFPIEAKNTNVVDSAIYINIAIVDDKVNSIYTDEYPFGRSILKPKNRQQHLEGHSLDYKYITWFRIWYASGFEKNDYGDRFGYYAVSGDKYKLDALEIDDELSKIFVAINSAVADSNDFKQLLEEPLGEPEYIYLRFKFSHAPYDQFGEFSIYHYIQDDPKVKEKLTDYIIVKHSDATRYLYRKDEYPNLAELLNEVAFKRYDKYFEPRSM